MKVMARPTKTFRDEIEEIAIMKTLTHENVVNLHEVIDDRKSRKIYIIQEFVEGMKAVTRIICIVGPLVPNSLSSMRISSLFICNLL
jgi:serine/threonine protein kinase